MSHNHSGMQPEVVQRRTVVQKIRDNATALLELGKRVASTLRASAMGHGVAKMRGRYGQKSSDAGGAAMSSEVAPLRRDKRGNIICIHNTRHYYCKTCGGKGICQHGLRRAYCRERTCAAAAPRLKNASRHRDQQPTFGSSLRSLASANYGLHASKSCAEEAFAAADGEKTFAVREVLGVKVKEVAHRACLVFKIWWMSYPKSKATEEPAENLSPHLVDIWKSNHREEWSAAMRKAARIEIKRIRRLDERQMGNNTVF
jgi:hypothetical protein